MRALAIALVCSVALALHAAGPFTAGGPATTNNDDSCDIAVMPAATLLLPYFEVDLTSATGIGETTIFTITNTANLPHVARVTLWTDRGYPVIAFNLFLTGYDVQSINLHDLLRRGRIAPDAGTGFDVSHVGELSGNTLTRTPHDNPLLDEASCVEQPVELPRASLTRMQAAFTTGYVSTAGSAAGCHLAGSPHENAVGYATIDVVGRCAATLPTEDGYFADDLRFDNVLAGDYLQIDGREDLAQGGPLVHVRAIPEGGTPATRRTEPDRYRVNFHRTFYSRLNPAAEPFRDARQPLPATFAARWIAGGAGGFDTSLKIWREGRSSPTTPCSAFPRDASMVVRDVVRFDEDENPETHGPPIIVCAPTGWDPPMLPLTSRSGIDDDVFPPHTQHGAGGWMYLNLDYCDRDTFAGQGWVISSMRAEGRFSVDLDSLALGNGCSAPTPLSQASDYDLPPIGPAPNVRPK